MKYLNLTIIAVITFITSAAAQSYLSHLQDTQNDPVFTTYAAAMSRSEFTVNEGYQFIWYDPAKGMNFETERAGNLGIIFNMNNHVVSELQQFYKKPVITTSYSDVVKYYYYPFKDVKVETTFLVYSSRIAIREMKIINESPFRISINVYPFIQNETRDYTNIKMNSFGNQISFMHKEFPDGWMKSHNIPFKTNLNDFLMFNTKVNSWGTYNIFSKIRDTSSSIFINAVGNNSLNTQTGTNESRIIAAQKSFEISAGQEVTFKVIKAVDAADSTGNTIKLIQECRNLFKADLNKYLQEDETVYGKIPDIKFDNEEYKDLYWNAFSLLRQCMLPAEGQLKTNYYVFSREPRWGWGYGGQVFHESLSMLAYVYMDPVSAMNSQRVFIQTQHENGYINYRTGPYLNETIPTNGQLTTSAPWFNWENWELYKVSHDKEFLKQAYAAGKKFYEFWVKNRDSNNDGLCEWGANAVLESVRDAYVAVWDQVGDPANFDALGLNLMLVKEANSLAHMAEELDNNDDYKMFTADARKRTELINKYMWDPETEFYYQVNKNDRTFTFKKKNDLKRKEIVAFLALWSGVASKEQAAALVKHLTDPKEFWRNYGIPSLSADDPYYNPIGYWNGPVWVPWNYLVFRGLIDYGYKKDAKELAERVLKNVDYQLKTNHWFWEFYSADDLQAGWHKTYIWTGIIARMLIDMQKL